MSQRRLSAIEARGGGLAAVTALARAKRLHLRLVVDEHGRELVAASARPFRVLC